MAHLQLVQVEQRTKTRNDINGQIKYRFDHQESYKDALLIDMTEAGVLVGLNEAIEINKELYLIMQSEEDQQSSVEFLVDPIRIADPIEGFSYCYGCLIVDVIHD